MSVFINSIELRNSPFEIKVAKVFDSSKIKFNRSDFKHGIIGDKLSGLIDTSEAGPGELTANCIGPHKIADCELKDQNNGSYLLKIKPKEIGKHYLHLKYNNEYLPDFPLAIKVFNPPDASKVKVYGDGILNGALENFISNFVCDTSGAGSGQLVVRIKGPRGFN